jgi:hypothetical protein
MNDDDNTSSGFNHWRIWKTIRNLQNQKLTNAFPSNHRNEESSSDETCIDQSYLQITDNIITILRFWGTSWLSPVAAFTAKCNTVDKFVSDSESTRMSPTEWAHLLNKKSLQHEIEESMVAIHYLEQWRQKTPSLDKKNQTIGVINKTLSNSFVAVDVCGGKGIFSLLLQYYSILFWGNDEYPQLNSIILIEKVRREDINWKHLNNLSALPDIVDLNSAKYPVIDIWDDCNLFSYDFLVEKFKNYKNQEHLVEYQYKYAFTGIHLC